MMFLARNLAQMNMRKKISYTPVVTAQSEKSVHANLYKLLTLRHENLPCILDVPSRWA